ncbi:MAG: DNA polymerase I [Bacteroidetes bacterium]|nr:MAG: DNA polymerase I [Bacteroidota bacterium]
MNQDKKLFLLDAMALIYRSYFAFIKNPRINSKGLNTSAMLGFTNTLFEILRKEKPDYIAVATDTKAPTQRHKDYEPYKAHREAMPDELAISIPYIYRILEAFRIPLIAIDGYEADDIIGTMAKTAEKEGFTTFMMTPDKDFAQLVSENIFMYKPARMGNSAEVWGVNEVKEKFEVERPEQVIDILGLWGDAADNIPGIPGIGEKRAKELVGRFGSVEGIIENVDQLKGKMKENVENFAEQGLLSKQLATIILDVPVEIEIKDLVRKEPDFDMLKELFDEFEFRTLAKRIYAEFGVNNREELVQVEKPVKAKKVVPQEETLDMFAQFEMEQERLANREVIKEIADNDSQYTIVENANTRKDLIAELSNQSIFSFHTITTNNDAHQAELAGVAFSFGGKTSCFLTLPTEYKEAVAILKEFESVFADNNIEKVGHDLKYSLAVLRWYQIVLKGKMFDTMLAHYLLEPDMKHSLDFLTETYVDYKIIPTEQLLGRKSDAATKAGKSKPNFGDVEVDLLKNYACERADTILQLKDYFIPKLKETNTLGLFIDMEIPLVKVLAAMETEGVNLDVEALEKYSVKLGDEVESTEKQIYELAGHEFNIASPKQLGVVLFDEMQIADKAKKTKTGQYKTGEDILVKLKKKHPIVELILEYRSLTKLKSTYVDALPKLVNPRTHRIHTTYNQAVASTGRLSSNNPNLQNIPIRSSRGREIRKAFIPRNDEYTLLAADYSQIELRLVAHLSQDKQMLEDFNSGKDVHTATAARVYDVSEEEVSVDMRRNAKGVNFGIIYGISAFGLSENINISRKEAAQMISNYFEQYPAIKNYMESQVEFAKEHSYVETILKRRRYLRDIRSENGMMRSFAERNAVNAPIQGSSADMIKVAMIAIQDELEKRNLKSKMILQVHDELIFDCLKGEVEEVRNLVVDKMKNAIELSVPIIVDVNSGANWLEAH